MDAVNHPRHYNFGNIEVITAIDDWGLGFSLGNAVKYIARAGRKHDKIEDLNKAIWYLQHEIELEKVKREEELSERIAIVGEMNGNENRCSEAD